jgi:hypothetical protein
MKKRRGIMKKRVLALIFAGMFILSGCSSAPTSKEKPPKGNEPAPKEAATAKTEEEKFLEAYINTNERPVAVMVDNDNDDARPHAGLDEAYLIYEIIIEGGSTRFMALYKNADTEKVGPVRSSRHYFLDYVMENDAIYTHFGWSPLAQQDIGKFKINKINGILSSDEKAFWRERKYSGDWHSAYTSIENVERMAEKKGYKTETEHKNGIKYAGSYITPNTGNAASEVVLKYSYKYTTGYTYNSEKGVYEKSINKAPHTMQNGNVLEVKNIIVVFNPDRSLGDGSDRRNINTVGSGKGYYITDGGYEEITWSKTARGANTVYKNASGEELMINPGKTIINIIASPSSVVIE